MNNQPDNETLVSRDSLPLLSPKITIITPSFNQGRFIESTILSVINQDYPNLEYIIIDGGSTDNTTAIIKKYQQHFTYWISEKDSGQSEAINKGLKLCKGDIINWLNSDDLLLPGSLKKIAALFEQHPGAVMVHGRIAYFGDENYFSANLPLKDLEERYPAHICMPQPACFFKRKLIDEQGLLDEALHFSMDTDLYVRAALHYQIVQVGDIFAKFRLHDKSKSVSVFNKIFLEDNKKIFSRVLCTLHAVKEIDELKKLDLFAEPAYLYKKPGKQFNTRKLLFYFLEHRLFTLHNHGDKKNFRIIFSYLFKNFPGLMLFSGKLLLYRITLLLPSGFLHTLAKLGYRGKITNYKS